MSTWPLQIEAMDGLETDHQSQRNIDILILPTTVYYHIYIWVRHIEIPENHRRNCTRYMINKTSDITSLTFKTTISEMFESNKSRESTTCILYFFKQTNLMQSICITIRDTQCWGKFLLTTTTTTKIYIFGKCKCTFKPKVKSISL